ncbi:MAG: hypothetical protein FH753_02320 [Firmicutes bacterium]|nr:hypothetical protein [Bacillota bacterium]
MKNLKNIFIVLFMVLILMKTVSATEKENIPIELTVNYGQDLTNDNTVILGLNVDEEVKKNDLKVQFSIDNKNWKGYDSKKDIWKFGISSKYQHYYPKFNIGTVAGNRDIYVKVTDSKGRVGYGKTNIVYSPEKNNPRIDSINNLTKGSGRGTETDPYIVNDKNIRIKINTINAKKVSYSANGKEWSNWKRINGNTTNLNIVLGKINSKVFLKTKNEYGVESTSKRINYIIDKKSPKLDISTKYNSFIATNGVVKFDIATKDDKSKFVDFNIIINLNGNLVKKSGRVINYIKDKLTYKEITIKGLPKGVFNTKVEVIDSAGNKNIKYIKIKSLE